MDFFSFHAQVNKRPSRGGTSADPPKDRPILTVRQLTTQIDQALQKHLPPTLYVKGEVSNFKLHAQSGHAYFTLKDPAACVSCVMFASDFERLKFKPQDGLELLATGR